MNTKKELVDNRAEVYHLLREMDNKTLDGFIDRLCEEIAFSSQNAGGVKFDPKMGWGIIKMNPFGNPVVEKYSSKEEAILNLNNHHTENNWSEYENLDEELQRVLCFPAPLVLKAFGKSKNSNINLELLTSSEQKKGIASEIKSKVKESVKKLISPKNHYETPLRNHPNLEIAKETHMQRIQDRLNDYMNLVQGSIQSWRDLELKDDHKLDSIKFPTKSWVQSRSEPSAFFIDSVRKVLLDTKETTIAEVLAYSHPILEKEFATSNEIDGTRKPINDNDVHGVFTTSNVKEIIERMAKKGFDNQPVYCKQKKQCIGTIRLKEALKNLFLGNYDAYPTFVNYEDMIRENLLLLPPPMFTAFDSIEYIVSLFNTGCEAILFRFDKGQWEDYGGDPVAIEVLSDGLHIITSHDIVIYLLNN